MHLNKMDISTKFLRTNPKLRRCIPKYADLKGVALSKSEKEWFCRQLLREFKDGEIDMIDELSQNDFIARYNLPRSTCRSWLKGGTRERGHPSDIDDIGMLSVFDKIAEGTAPKRGAKKDPLRRPTTKEVSMFMTQAKQETKKRKGKDVHVMDGTMDFRTMRKYKKKKVDGRSIQSGMGQVLTTARLKSRACPTLSIQVIRKINLLVVYLSLNRWFQMGVM
jgi:hypothetical protein